jgi:heme oxygenase (biliverdin-IX-beta and delta-forming)
MSTTAVELASSLSAQLRSQTARQHAQLESLLGLPGCIRTRDDYVLWLGRFLGVYEPLECSLAGFPEWEAFGFAPPPRTQASCLSDDLATLGADPRQVPRVAFELLPAVPTFAHALGARYVLEGATLGGRIILRDLNAQTGRAIAGATQFFGGRGKATGSMWHDFRGKLDIFGRAHPELRADVVTGAQRTFGAMSGWFIPFCVATVRRV